MFETHYEIDQSYEAFDPKFLTSSVVDNKMHIYYADVLVHAQDKGKLIDEGTSILGKLLTSREAISLWQMCYLSKHISYDPERCAHIYREVNRLCHTCYGDGQVLTNEELVDCTVCSGTGIMPRKKREEQWLT